MNSSKSNINIGTFVAENSSDYAAYAKIVKLIFRRFEELYGGNWSRRLTLEPNELIRVWATEIQGMSIEDIRHGLDVCFVRHKTFPPTLPEFYAACAWFDPYEAPQIAFDEAVNNWSNRKNKGVSLEWSHPAIYRASIAFGVNSLSKATWESAKGKWIFLLRTEMEKRKWPPIPVEELKRCEPEKKPASKEVGKAFLEQAKKLLGSKTPSYKK